MTIRDIFLASVLIVCLVIAIALCGGAWGASDLEMRIRASEPINL